MQALLVVDGVSNLCCAFSLLFHVSPLQAVCTSLWKVDDECSNDTASHFMAYLILVWGAMRLLAGLGWGLEWACVSYLIEVNVFACETLLFERMHFAQGMGVSVSSFLLALCIYYMASLQGWTVTEWQLNMGAQGF